MSNDDDEAFAASVASAERLNLICRREAAPGTLYRDTTAMRRVMDHPAPDNVRLAFEAGYAAALSREAAAPEKVLA